MKKILCLGLMFLCISIVTAHLDAGSDVVVNGYWIDFGYAPEHPMIDNKTTFLFNILNASTNESIDPDHVWVRISQNDTILFSGQFRPAAKSVTFTYTFGKPGDYDIMATFYDNSTALVQYTFNIGVVGLQPVNAVSYVNVIIALMIMFITIGIILLIIFKRRFSHKHPR